ncbi:Beta-barrel assembly machine subunit BamA [Tranquillimonas rosea]|uniref:Outer membrane protein assembly factor BamA n=2 Tax=Tranquillimonas rosea TaxID=641238 RepID=A0A1H9PED0_9RHOB|nr:Beta-barrel assembly machine subunit BamA [Tranquillimonas rosea]
MSNRDSGVAARRKGAAAAVGRGIGMASVAAMLATAPLPQVAHAQTYSFSNVAIQGNQRIEPNSIASIAGIPQGQAVGAATLNDAYQRLVNSGLFRSVEIEPQGGTLVIRVEEYPTINRINIEGNDRLSDDELRPLVESTPRRVYNPTQAEADAAAITNAYQQAGRVAASVSPRIIERSDNRVDLVFEVAEGGVSEIERVSFVGNRAYSDRRLRGVLETKQAGLLRQIIQRDTFVSDRIGYDRQLLTDFYNSRGYADFRITNVSSEFARDRGAFFIQFNIEEGQQFDFGQITASSDLAEVNAQEFLNVARTRAGSTYTPTAIERDVARMERLAIQKGLNFVRVEPQISRNERTLTLDVNYRLTRGPRVFVERIDIEGNQTTLDRVVRRQFRTVEGDPFNPRQIRQAAERIRALNYFSNVDVETSQGSAEDQVVVDVNVEEQPTGSLSFGASYSLENGPGLSVSFSERNFLGRGQTLAFSYNTGTDSADSSITFIEPYFLGRDLRYRFSAFYNTTDNDAADYDTEILGFSTGFEFPISENGRLGLTYRLAEAEISDVSEDTSPIIQAEEGSKVTSSLGYELSYDTRVTGLNPNAGVLLEFGQTYAGVGGDNEYIETRALASAQTRVYNEEVTLRATIEGGAIHMLDGDSRVTDRYFLSSRQMRGFGSKGLGPRDLEAENEDALGGNVYAVARFEAEFPIGVPEEYGITGGVFADAGSVWSLDNTSGANGVEVDDDFHLRSVVGVSLFWTTPIGPLRFNFSKALQKETYDEEEQFAITISTRF